MRKRVAQVDENQLPLILQAYEEGATQEMLAVLCGVSINTFQQFKRTHREEFWERYMLHRHGRKENFGELRGRPPKKPVKTYKNYLEQAKVSNARLDARPRVQR